MTKIITDNSKVNINLLKENELLKKQVEELLLNKKELEKQLALVCCSMCLATNVDDCHCPDS